VLAASYPYFAKRLLTDPNPYLRNALIELLFKDGSFRWNRLENLLKQGRKDADYQAKDVMQPVLQLLLAPEADELQQLVEREVVRVTEAMIVGTAIQGISSIPPAVRALLPPVNASTKDQAAMLMLREQVLRVWGLLQSSRGFDPAMLQPLVQVGYSDIVYRVVQLCDQ
jgi:aarF domain-containing kinase